MSDETKKIDVKLDVGFTPESTRETEKMARDLESIETIVDRLQKKGEIKPLKSLGNLLPEATQIDKLVETLQKTTDAAIGKILNSTISRLNNVKPGSDLERVLEARFHQLDEVIARRVASMTNVTQGDRGGMPADYNRRFYVNQQKVAQAGLEREYEQMHKQMLEAYAQGMSHGNIQKIRDDFSKKVTQTIQSQAVKLRDKADDAVKAMDQASSAIDDIFDTISVKPVVNHSESDAEAKKFVNDAKKTVKKSADALKDKVDDVNQEVHKAFSAIDNIMSSIIDTPPVVERPSRKNDLTDRARAAAKTRDTVSKIIDMTMEEAIEAVNLISKRPPLSPSSLTPETISAEMRKRQEEANRILKAQIDKGRKINYDLLSGGDFLKSVVGNVSHVPMYHGTPSGNVDSILKEGIKFGSRKYGANEENKIFVTLDREQAEEWGRLRSQDKKSSRVVVVKVPTEHLDYNSAASIGETTKPIPPENVSLPKSSANANKLFQSASKLADLYEDQVSRLNSDTKKTKSEINKMRAEDDRLDKLRQEFMAQYNASTEQEQRDILAVVNKSNSTGGFHVEKLIENRGVFQSAAREADSGSSDLAGKLVDKVRQAKVQQDEAVKAVNAVTEHVQSKLLIVAKDLMELAHSGQDTAKQELMSRRFASLAKSATAEELSSVGSMVKSYSRRTGYNPQPVFTRALGRVPEEENILPDASKGVFDVNPTYRKAKDQDDDVNPGFRINHGVAKPRPEVESLSALAQKALDLQLRLRNKPGDRRLTRELKHIIEGATDEQLAHSVAGIERFYKEELLDTKNPEPHIQQAYAMMSGTLRDRSGAIEAFKRQAEKDKKDQERIQKELDAKAKAEVIGVQKARGVRVKHQIYPQNDPDQTVYDRKNLPSHTMDSIQSVRDSRDQTNNLIKDNREAVQSLVAERGVFDATVQRLASDTAILQQQRDEYRAQIDRMLNENLAHQIEQGRKVHIRTRLSKGKIAERNRVLGEDNATRSARAQALQEASDQQIEFRRRQDEQKLLPGETDAQRNDRLALSGMTGEDRQFAQEEAARLEEERQATLNKRKKAMADEQRRTMRSRPRVKQTNADIVGSSDFAEHSFVDTVLPSKSEAVAELADIRERKAKHAEILAGRRSALESTQDEITQYGILGSMKSRQFEKVLPFRRGRGQGQGRLQIADDLEREMAEIQREIAHRSVEARKLASSVSAAEKELRSVEAQERMVAKTIEAIDRQATQRTAYGEQLEGVSGGPLLTGGYKSKGIDTLLSMPGYNRERLGKTGNTFTHRALGDDEAAYDSRGKVKTFKTRTAGAFGATGGGFTIGGERFSLGEQTNEDRTRFFSDIQEAEREYKFVEQDLQEKRSRPKGTYNRKIAEEAVRKWKSVAKLYAEVLNRADEEQLGTLQGGYLFEGPLRKYRNIDLEKQRTASRRSGGFDLQSAFTNLHHQDTIPEGQFGRFDERTIQGLVPREAKSVLAIRKDFGQPNYISEMPTRRPVWEIARGARNRIIDEVVNYTEKSLNQLVESARTGMSGIDPETGKFDRDLQNRRRTEFEVLTQAQERRQRMVNMQAMLDEERKKQAQDTAFVTSRPVYVKQEEPRAFQTTLPTERRYDKLGTTPHLRPQGNGSWIPMPQRSGAPSSAFTFVTEESIAAFSMKNAAEVEARRREMEEEERTRRALTATGVVPHPGDARPASHPLANPLTPEYKAPVTSATAGRRLVASLVSDAEKAVEAARQAKADIQYVEAQAEKAEEIIERAPTHVSAPHTPVRPSTRVSGGAGGGIPPVPPTPPSPPTPPEDEEPRDHRKISDRDRALLEEAARQAIIKNNMNVAMQEERQRADVLKLADMKVDNELRERTIMVKKAKLEGRAPILGDYGQMIAGEELEASRRKQMAAEGDISEQEYRDFRAGQLRNRQVARDPVNEKFMLYGASHRIGANKELARIAAQNKADQERMFDQDRKRDIEFQDIDHKQTMLGVSRGEIDPLFANHERRDNLENRLDNDIHGEPIYSSAVRQRALQELKQLHEQEKKIHHEEIEETESYNKSMNRLGVVSNDELKQYYAERLGTLNARSKEASRLRSAIYQIDKEDYGAERASKLQEYRQRLGPSRERIIRGSAARGFGQSLSGFGQSATYMFGMPAAAAGYGSLEEAIKFESQFKSVEQMTQGELGHERGGEAGGRARLRKFMMAESIKTGIDTEEVNKTAATAAQLGVVRKEGAAGLERYTDTVLKMGEAIKDMDADTAARKMAQLMNVTQTGSAEVHKMASELAQLHKVGGAATSRDMLELSLRIAGIGKAVGMTPDQIIAIGSAVAASGVKAEQGGTSVQRFILQMSLAAAKNEEQIKKLRKQGGEMGLDPKDMDKNQKSLAQFAGVAGLKPGDFEQLFEKDAHGVSHAAEAVDRFVTGLRRLQDEGHNVSNVLTGMGIKQQRMFATLLQTSNANLMGDFLGEGKVSYDADKALEDMFADRMKTTQKQIDKVRQSLKIAGLELGTSFLPLVNEKILPQLIVLADKADDFAKAIGKWPDAGKEALLFLGAVSIIAGPAAIMIGGLASAVGNFMVATGTLQALRAGKPLSEIINGRFEGSSAADLSRQHLVSLEAKEKLSGVGVDVDKVHAEKAAVHDAAQSIKTDVESVRKTTGIGKTISTGEKILENAGNLGNAVSGLSGLKGAKGAAKELGEIGNEAANAEKKVNALQRGFKNGVDVKLFEGLTNRLSNFLGIVGGGALTWNLFKGAAGAAFTFIAERAMFAVGRIGLIGAVVGTAYLAVKGYDFGNTSFGKFLDKLSGATDGKGHLGGLQDIADAWREHDELTDQTRQMNQTDATPGSHTLSVMREQAEVAKRRQKQIDVQQAASRRLYFTGDPKLDGVAGKKPGDKRYTDADNFGTHLPSYQNIQDTIKRLSDERDAANHEASRLMIQSGRESNARQYQRDAPLRAKQSATFSPGVERWRDKAKKYADKYGVDIDYVLSIMQAESGGNPRDRSKAGAMGLMQIMPGKKGVTDAFDPDQNLDAGVRELAANLKRRGGDYALAAAGYNAGMGAVDKYGGIPPYKETQGYVKNVMGKYNAVKSYKGKKIEPFDPSLYDVALKKKYVRDQAGRDAVEALKGPGIDLQTMIENQMAAYDEDGDKAHLIHAKELTNQLYSTNTKHLGPLAKDFDAKRHNVVTEYPDRRNEAASAYQNNLKQLEDDRVKKIRAIDKKLRDVQVKDRFASAVGETERAISDIDYAQAVREKVVTQYGTLSQRLHGTFLDDKSSRARRELEVRQATLERDRAKSLGKGDNAEIDETYKSAVQRSDHDLSLKLLDTEDKRKEIRIQMFQLDGARLQMQERMVSIEMQGYITDKKKREDIEAIADLQKQDAYNQYVVDSRSKDPMVVAMAGPKYTATVAQAEAEKTRSLISMDINSKQVVAQLDRQKAEATDDLTEKVKLLTAARLSEMEAVKLTNNEDAIALETQKQSLEIQREKFSIAQTQASRGFAAFMMESVPERGASRASKAAHISNMNKTLDEYSTLATSSEYTADQRSSGISAYAAAIDDVRKRGDLSPKQAFIRASNAMSETLNLGTGTKQDYDALHGVAKGAEFQIVDERLKEIKRMSPWNQENAAKSLKREIENDPLLAADGLTKETLDHFKDSYKGAIKEIGREFERTMGDASKNAVQTFLESSMDPTKRKGAGKAFAATMESAAIGQVSKSLTDFGSDQFNKVSGFLTHTFKDVTGIGRRKAHKEDDRQMFPDNQDGKNTASGQVQIQDGGLVSGIHSAAKEIPKATKQSKADMMSGAASIFGAATALSLAMNPKHAKKSAMGGLFGSILGAVAGSLLPGAGWMAGAELGGGIGGLLGSFAKGGDPPVGIPSWVGEKGPELFVPKIAGTIYDHARSMEMVSRPSIDSRSSITSSSRDHDVVGLLKKIADKDFNNFNVAQNIHGDVHKEVDLDNAGLSLGSNVERIARSRG